MSDSREGQASAGSGAVGLRLKEGDALPGVPSGWLNFALKPLQPCALGLARAGVSPDVLSLASGLSACIGAGTLWAGFHFWAIFLFLFSGVLDLLDGWVARLQSKASARGEVLDAFMDRLADFSFVFALALRFQGEWAWQIPLWGASFAMSSISLLSAKAEWAGLVPAQGWFRRAGRSLILFFGLLLSALWDPVACLPLWGALVFVALAGTGSAILRFLELRTALSGSLRGPLPVASRGDSERRLRDCFSQEAVGE